jgi:hypothetical protein
LPEVGKSLGFPWGVLPESLQLKEMDAPGGESRLSSKLREQRCDGRMTSEDDVATGIQDTTREFVQELLQLLSRGAVPWIWQAGR